MHPASFASVESGEIDFKHCHQMPQMSAFFEALTFQPNSQDGPHPCSGCCWFNQSITWPYQHCSGITLLTFRQYKLLFMIVVKQKLLSKLTKQTGLRVKNAKKRSLQYIK